MRLDSIIARSQCISSHVATYFLPIPCTTEWGEIRANSSHFMFYLPGRFCYEVAKNFVMCLQETIRICTKFRNKMAEDNVVPADTADSLRKFESFMKDVSHSNLFIWREFSYRKIVRIDTLAS